MNNNSQKQVGQYRPRLSFYHPNAKNTGCAIQMELYPAHDDKEGCIMLCAARQISVGNRHGTSPTFSRFDWENAICVKLGFTDLCKFLQVFRGEIESIDEGRGLYHKTAKASTRIVLRHMIEPAQGYSLEFYRTPTDGGADIRMHVLLSLTEAIGLCEAIAGAMYLIGFGIPQVIHRSSSVVKTQVEEVKNDAA